MTNEMLTSSSKSIGTQIDQLKL